jgi:hypothetical protein
MRCGKNLNIPKINQCLLAHLNAPPPSGKGAGMTKEDIIHMAREAGYSNSQDWSVLVRFANLVIVAEREACAKLIEENGWYEAAAAIRARGNK